MPIFLGSSFGIFHLSVRKEKRKVIFSSVLFMVNSFPFFLEPIFFFSFSSFSPPQYFTAKTRTESKPLSAIHPQLARLHSPDIRVLSVLSHCPPQPALLLWTFSSHLFFWNKKQKVQRAFFTKLCPGAVTCLGPRHNGHLLHLFLSPIKPAKIWSGLGWAQDVVSPLLQLRGPKANSRLPPHNISETPPSSSYHAWTSWRNYKRSGKRNLMVYQRSPAFTNQLSEKSSPGSPAPSQGKYLSRGPTNKGQGREPCPKPHNDSLGKPGMQPPDHNCLMATTTELLLSVQEKAPLIPQLGFLYMLLLRTWH